MLRRGIKNVSAVGAPARLHLARTLSSLPGQGMLRRGIKVLARERIESAANGGTDASCFQGPL